MGDIVGVVFSSWALELVKTVQKEKQTGRVRSEHCRMTGKSKICHLPCHKLGKEKRMMEGTSGTALGEEIRSCLAFLRIII